IPLTVPVAKANSKTLTKDLKIIYATPWQKLHFRSIESAYKNSPYYDYYIDDLMPFFEKKETYLLDLNNAILETLLGLLKIQRNLRMTKDYIPENTGIYTDLRDVFHPKPAKRKTGVEFSVYPYRQTFNDRFPFAPNLSILDLLFCCGTEGKF
ncbi:MAG: WbqC family protein, partial [Odoribacter sp.]|nr:WbqC family protein [Odoribacter sp.]